MNKTTSWHVCFFLVWFGFMAYQPSRVIMYQSHTCRTEWYYLTHSCGDKGLHIFLKGISLKLNVMVQLDFKLDYYNVVV